MGKSGCGKSSLLRVVGGLWKPASGRWVANTHMLWHTHIHATHTSRVIRPTVLGKGGMLFLPQRSYTPEGTLKQQLCYPDPVETCTMSDAELITVS